MRSRLATSRSSIDPDRAIGFQLILLFLFLAVASVVVAMLVLPMDLINDFTAASAEGTRYEGDAAEMNNRTWAAFSALPFVGTLMGLVWVVATAVLLSAR